MALLGVGCPHMKYKYAKIPYSSITSNYRCEKCSIDYYNLLGKLSDGYGVGKVLYSVKPDNVKGMEVVCGRCIEKLEKEDCDWVLGLYSLQQEVNRIRGLQASKVILDEVQI